MMKRIFGLILAFSAIFAMSCAKEECKAHSFGDWKVSVASTCTTEGTECRVCELCGESEERKIALVAHTYGDWQVEKAATCTDDGTEKRSGQERSLLFGIVCAERGAVCAAGAIQELPDH